MGYTIPEGVDTMLDVVGVGWPNVDEDAYRDMADALREFAEDADGDAGVAYGHVQRLLATGQSESLTALDKHWSKVQGKHKDLAKAARIVAGALDRVADIIVARKIAAVGELADLCATVGITLAFAPVTAGLSTLLAGAKIAATRIAFKRILKEMAEAAVAEIVATLTEPAVAAIENIVADLAIQTVMNATGVQDGYNTDQTVQAGKEGLQLNSASGPTGPGRGKGPEIDHDAHGKAGMHLASVQINMRDKTGSKLGKAKSHHGRAKGKDSLTAVLDTTIEGVTDKLTKALNDLGDHVGKKVPDAITKGSKTHKDTDGDVRDRVKRIVSKDGKDEGVRDGRRDNSGPQRRRPASMREALGRARDVAMSLLRRRCKTDPVDVASGEMVLPQTDLELPGTLPLILRRTHISGYGFGHCYGPSWASTFDERLEMTGTGAAWARDDGSILLYPALPGDDGEEILPLEGDRIPLVFVERGSLGDITYSVTDTHSGLTRRFTGNPYRAGGLYWLHEVEDRNGNAWRISRTEEGLPTAVQHDGGYHVTVTTDADLHRVTGLALRTPDGPAAVTTFGYDGYGNLESVCNASGAPLRFTYDDQRRITSWTDRNNHPYSYVYDEAGRVVETMGPGGALSSRFAYDAVNRITRFTDSTGAVTVSHLNELGQVVAETDPLGNTVRREWDRYDNLLSRTDELGHTAHFTWDDRSNLTSVRPPDGSVSRMSYDDTGLPVEATLADGATWRQSYDDRGNRTSVTAPDGTTSTYRFDASGALVAETDPTGAVERTTYNTAGLPLTVTDPLGKRHTVERDAFGRPVRSTDPAGAVTRIEWTGDGLLSRCVAPDGTVETWTWDDEGNCLSYTDPQGRTTSFEYTHFDLLAARTGADGARYEFTYDTELRLTQVRNPQGLTWTYTHDAAGNLVSETDFDGRTVTYAYDAAGRPAQRTTPLGATITTAYDTCGRLVAKDTAGRVTRFTYDAAGNATSVVSPTSTVEWQRDALGRLVAETVDGRTIRFAYDAAGRTVRRTTPTGAVSESSYDAAGRRTTLRTNGRVLAFTHDPLGRELTRTLGDSQAPLTLTSRWDIAGRLASRVVATPDGPLRASAYTYRADGFLMGVTDELKHTTTHYDLDPVGRPTRITGSGWTETYAYDLSGNQTTADWPDRARRADRKGARTYEGTRLLTAGALRCEYDAAGRTVMRQRTRLSRKPDTWRYTWDEENRLTGCRTPDGTQWQYTYDPLGRRTAKHRLADNGDVLDSVYFTWDGTHLVEQSDTATNTTLTWDYAGRTPLAQLERRTGSGTEAATDDDEVDSRFFAIVSDLIGAPTELVDEHGEVAWQARTTVWGTTTWNRSATAYTPLRFPGQYDDPESGLFYNCFRYYDPTTARYLTPDPLGLDAAPNPVGYVTNPQMWMDPEGLIAKGCTEEGGWYNGLKPANLKNDDGTRRTDTEMEINHIPAKNSYAHLDEPGFRTNARGGGAGMGPAIRMDYDDHRRMTSTGSSAKSVKWREQQRKLIDAGRWDQAMMMDIRECRKKFGNKYDTHIADMISSLKDNKKFQDMLTKRGWTVDYNILK